MAEKLKKIKDDALVIDKKRVLIGVIIFAVILGAGALWVKNTLPHFLAAQEKKLDEKTASQGQVAGEADINVEGLQDQIDKIKNDVTKIKVEDVKEQEAVKKILNDLESLKEKATESAKVLDVKGNLCEEVKRRFCQ